MLRTTVPIAVAALGAAVAPSAAAASPSANLSNGGVIVSADRLVPVVDYWSATTTNANGSKSSTSRTSLMLVTSNPAGEAATFYTLPRIGLDVVVLRGLTIGGSAWIYTDLSASTSTTPANSSSSTSQDQPKATYWGVAPRVGYVLSVADVLAIWPRVGVEFHDVSTGSVTNQQVTTGGSSLTELALDLEAMLVITPWNHFGFTIGPMGAIPLTGTRSTTTTFANGQTNTTSNDSSMVAVGLNAGLLGYF